MSVEAVKWAMYESPPIYTAAGKPDATARLVLIAHAERADEHGRNSFPGPAALMESTLLDERTIDRAEKRLEAAGLLKRDGISRHGTTCWHLNMSMVRGGESDGYAARARLERRRQADARRQRARRERLRGESASTRGEAVTDSASVTSRTLNPDVTDSASGCHGRNAPQTILRTTHEPPFETIPGGTLPPDPLRPLDPRSSDPRNEPEISPLSIREEPPRPVTATHDRARETGHGFCLACGSEGKLTLADDPVHGSRCGRHATT